MGKSEDHQFGRYDDPLPGLAPPAGEVMTRVLVAGPPCGGKTTYARKNAKDGETILDFDDLVQQMTGDRYNDDPAVLEAARVEFARLIPTSDWVVWNAPRRGQRGRIRSRYGAMVVVVMASEDVCLRRARDLRPPAWKPMVSEWFAAFEPSRSGELIIDTTAPGGISHG